MSKQLGEPLLFELSRPGRKAVELPVSDVPDAPLADLLAAADFRDDLPLPELAEPDVIRHYTHLSQRNYSIDSGFYPLGSCTMKYNPKINEEAARLPGFARLHPATPPRLAQGAMRVLYDMQHILAEIGGMDACSLQPAAGAHGELLGLMLIKAYHEDHGNGAIKDTILTPDAAHGTNPASAARCGYRTAAVKSHSRGRVDIDHLRSLLNERVAGIMLTNPNTLGLFEDNIDQIAELVHGVGGLLYCDGANMNALVGRARPGDMGFDVMHFNLHKTFSTPHGGGGPGSGPVAVKKALIPYLPSGLVAKTADGAYTFEKPGPLSIGSVAAGFGSFMVILRAYVYILTYGREKISRIAENAVLNANYLRMRLGKDLDVAYNELCMHECIFTAKRQQKAYGVKAYDIAKRLMDYGYHPPTIYFPLIVHEALMIEPTETESRETLDAFVEAMQAILTEARETPELLSAAPVTTPVRRLDEATAARHPCLRWSCDVSDGANDA
ncbi:MAG: aminomethyl-transferring glycine dehydrogenase subunit GcvPB [Capsulimonadaceae bacterium]|nr:aminomethyl-transferring glycine dehydrogenase subunit GcvPB [Capsulimonadaceae bacterium]